jgi:hypothetical protein
MVRIPESVVWEEKHRRIHEIVDALDMNKCLHTGKCQFSLFEIYFSNTNLIYAIFIGEKT